MPRAVVVFPGKDQDTYGRTRGSRRVARRSTLAHVRAFFGPVRALDVTTDRVNQYIGHRQEEGATNATIRQELSHLKRAFNLHLRAA